MKTLEDFLDTLVDPKKIVHTERTLAEASRLNKIAQRWGLLLVSSLVLLSLLAGSATYRHHYHSQGITHFDRVQLLRLVDDINR